ncbi:MAG: DUF1492 domain-containing protein [Clostridia bacterium]|nr:DUF1492 domain-containing protein [Clostridia bacterium]
MIDWLEVAIEDLKNYRDMIEEQQDLADRLEELEYKYQSVASSPTENTRVQGGKMSREDFLINNITERERLKCELAANKKLIAITERVILTLPEEERIILQYIYIDKRKKAIQALIDELSVEQSQIYRMKDKAIMSFTCAMYGVREY